MDVQDIFTQEMIAMTIPEIVAVITGIASVWFAKKENILVYPVGIISVLIYVYIFLNVKLYADAAINFYYFVMSIYGWYYWKKGGIVQRKLEAQSIQENEKPMDLIFDENENTTSNNEQAEISFNSLRENLMFMLYTAIIFIILVFILKNYTNSDVALWDGSITAVFFIAMILMARKKIENWIFWIIGDAAAIPLCIYKGLYFTAFQYLIFTIIAIAGFLSWYNKLQKRYKQEQKI
ncbi:MAG: nicotinamide mononucleotide transporter [Fimbriimonadaceae bacterium]|nr:nicotinamide mononucleotide transporter [Chitinophagales bacterium]